MSKHEQGKHGWFKHGQRMMDSTRGLTLNEMRVYQQLAILSRKPYAGDPSRNIPATPADEVGMVRAERGRRFTNTRLSPLCGVPRRHIGEVLESLIERGLIERTEECHLRVRNLAYLTGENDEPNPFQKDGMKREVAPKGGNPDSAPRRGNRVAPKRGTSGEFLPQKEATTASFSGGRWTAESLDLVRPDERTTETGTAGGGGDSHMDSDSQRHTKDGTRAPSNPDMLSQPQRQSEGGAGNNMTGEEVIAVLAGHPFPNGEPMNPSSLDEIAALGCSADEVSLVLLAHPKLNAGGIVRLFRRGRSVIDPVLAQARRIRERDESSEPDVAVDPPESEVVEDPDAERSLGIDLVKEMKSEYRENRSVGLIRRHGIPLTAALFRKVRPDFPLEQIAGGIEERLRIWLERDQLEIIWHVARKSSTSSPYPEWFPLLDWRERFAPIWEDSHARVKEWWSDEDRGGRSYAEYEEFRASADEVSPTCEEEAEAEAEVEDEDGCPAVEPPDASNPSPMPRARVEAEVPDDRDRDDLIELGEWGR